MASFLTVRNGVIRVFPALYLVVLHEMLQSVPNQSS
jgi:hypothetical protein